MTNSRSWIRVLVATSHAPHPEVSVCIQKQSQLPVRRAAACPRMRKTYPSSYCVSTIHTPNSSKIPGYSRRDDDEALSLSIRSIDYLITTGRLPSRRVEGKILIPVSAVRRFAREDHPDSVRTAHVSDHAKAGRHSSGSSSRFQPQSEGLDDAAPRAADTHRAF